MPLWNNLGFQDANSPLMEQLIFFHDHTMLVVTTIIVFIGYFMSTTLWNKPIHRTLLENQSIEVIWTCIPAIILIFIAIPSLKLLYMLDEVSSPEMTTKAIGHQWYWSYEYADFPKVNFDSYMIPSSELTDNSPRLLDTDNHIPLPMNMHHRILVTATDVIHSWTIPSLGVKADAVPGRLNQLSINLTRPGLFYGQCSEICGTNHSFMPIVLESLAAKDFIRMMA